ncbi:MAG: hypothetical protein ACPIOQ_41555, partial [Promethearchaeia archaeon]
EGDPLAWESAQHGLQRQEQPPGYPIRQSGFAGAVGRATRSAPGSQRGYGRFSGHAMDPVPRLVPAACTHSAACCVRQMHVRQSFSGAVAPCDPTASSSALAPSANSDAPRARLSREASSNRMLAAPDVPAVAQSRAYVLSIPG